MRKPEKAFCRADGKWITDYRADIGIGLAPGGIAKVWSAFIARKSLFIVWVVGAIYKKGPYQGKNEGRYALPFVSGIQNLHREIRDSFWKLVRNGEIADD